ncbi:MAG: DUF4175 family protein [Holosporales bacterium]
MIAAPRFSLALATALWRSGTFTGRLAGKARWPLYSITALIFLSLLGILALLPALLQTMLVLGAAGWVIISLLLALQSCPFPTTAEAETALERINNLKHQPLFTRRDHPAFVLSPAGGRQWLTALRQAFSHSTRSYRLWFAPTGYQRFFIAVALILLTALLWTRGEALIENLTPRLPIPGISDPLKITVELIPPTHTNLPVMRLNPNKAIVVPTGAQLRVRVTGTSLTPRLRLNKKSFPFEHHENGLVFTAPLHENSTIWLRHGLQRRGAYQVHLTPDLPPDIHITKIESDRSGTVNISYKGHDDYGITHLTAILLKPGTTEETDRQNLFNLPQGTKTINATRGATWANTPLAGTMVDLILEATDAAGNISRTDPQPMTVPKRQFENILAQKLILVRDSLEREDISPFAAGRLLNRFSEPVTNFNQHWSAFLAVRIAIAQLLTAERKGRPASDVPLLLWNAAVDLDHTAWEDSRAALRQAAENLHNALSTLNPSRSDVERALAEYRQALGAYLQTFSRNTNTDAANTMAEHMTASLEALIANGDTAEAQKRLEQMQKLLDRLQPGPPTPQQQALLTAAQALQRLALEQRKQAQNIAVGKEQPAQAEQQRAMAENIAAVQDALSKAGVSPLPTIEQSRQAVLDAADALEHGDTATARQASTLAATLLEQSSNSTRQQSGILDMNTMSSLGNESFEITPQDTGNELGKMLEELRRRINDSSRPERERRYLKKVVE